MDNYKRPIVAEILTALKSEPKKLLHILIGPRQVGKSTAAMQIAQEWDGPVISVSADSPVPPDYNWLSS